jgi:hypothetical protein
VVSVVRWLITLAFDLYITSLVECSQCTAVSKGNKKPVHIETILNCELYLQTSLTLSVTQYLAGLVFLLVANLKYLKEPKC